MKKSGEKARAQMILQSHLCFLCLFAAFETAAQTRVDYSQFRHSNPKHQLECQTCHKFPSQNWKAVRKETDAFPDISEFPEHQTCIGCHRKQFFARERPAPRICLNCHVKATPNDTSRYPFPSLREAFLATPSGAKFVAEFRVQFPHDKHSDQECTDCHESAESPKTKPVAHALCFTCHNQESELPPSPQSCDTCHKIGSETSRRLFAHAVPQSPTDYSQFKHDNKNHARLPCLLCHRRENNSAQPTLPGKDQHTPCVGCHAPLFANNSGPVCTICHTDDLKTVKAFPPLKSFSSSFDHALHAASGAKCGSCHRPLNRGVALTIPAGAKAHNACFSCHQPQAKASGRDISSCGVCHQPGPPVRASTRAVAFRRGFSHAHHDGSESLSCSACHRVRARDPQRKEVTAPIPLNHHAPARGFSCMSCHNGKRAFGGDDFAVCTRCHKGSQWRF